MSFIHNFVVIIVYFNTVVTSIMGNKVEFGSSHFGVVFSPFAKRLEGGIIPAWNQYAMQEVRTMYELVADRFEMTATYKTGANDEKYERHISYRRTKDKIVLCPEAASLVNIARKKKALSVLIGVTRHTDSTRKMNTEIELAFESAQIANQNYPGTATGIIFHSNDIKTGSALAQETLNQISSNKPRAHFRDLKVGTRQSCELLLEKRGGTLGGDPDAEKALKIFKEIIVKADFIICNIFMEHKNLSLGVDAIATQVQKEVQFYKDAILKTNKRIDVMFETGWPTKGGVKGLNVQGMVTYWQKMNKWAGQNGVKVWMVEAFDQPWKSWNPEAEHFGWWKLKRNEDAGKKSGYIEKNSVFTESTTTSVWIYVGIALGIVSFIVLVAIAVFLYFRANKLREILTTQDINDFVHGTSGDNPTEEGTSGQQAVDNALRVAYNKDKFEISKENILISTSWLGSGEFGDVFKATVNIMDGGFQEVALKMAKSDCSKTGLKSLLSEIKILTYLDHHPNIVSIVGAYTKEMSRGIVYVATEICVSGSLENYLRNARFEAPDAIYENLPVLKAVLAKDGAQYTKQAVIISLREMVRWSHEIACGMEYLGKKNVVHADLATRNVLLTEKNVAKITDFGLSRRMYQYTNYIKQQEEPLPWRWMSIESLKRLEFSSKSDVWSYGITLWEMFSMGDVPYPGLSWDPSFVASLEDGIRIKPPRHSTQKIYSKMLECWNVDPNCRPAFADLRIFTEELMNNETL